MAVRTIEELFVHGLSEPYSGGKHLTRALPGLARQTPGQVERIEQIVQPMDLCRKRMTYAAMKGLIEEGKDVIDSIDRGPVRDQRAAERSLQEVVAGRGDALITRHTRTPGPANWRAAVRVRASRRQR